MYCHIFSFIQRFTPFFEMSALAMQGNNPCVHTFIYLMLYGGMVRFNCVNELHSFIITFVGENEPGWLEQKVSNVQLMLKVLHFNSLS